MRVRSLHFYPVKGARSVDVDIAHVHLRGLSGDRRWVVTDEDGLFLTQRTCPELARLMVVPTNTGLRLEMDGECEGLAHEGIEVETPAGDQRDQIRVWLDAVDAPEARNASPWLTSALGRPARLFYMDDGAHRTTSGKWAPKTPMSFADGYPLLIVTAASLDVLNAEICKDGGEAVPMARFRPNIVIEGTDPWADDFWGRVKIGNVELDLVKPCERCLVTTKDQKTGAKLGREPLKMLARMRKSAHEKLPGVLFGWNVTPCNEGIVKIGDAVEVTRKRPEGWPFVEA